LDAKEERRGTGAFLQTRHVSSQGEGKDRTWFIHGKKLDSNATYQVAINDFLLAGHEKGFEFLKLPTDEAEGRSVGDWRKIVSDHLRNKKAVAPQQEPAPAEPETPSPVKAETPSPVKAGGEVPWLRIAHVLIGVLVALGLPTIIVVYCLLRS